MGTVPQPNNETTSDRLRPTRNGRKPSTRKRGTGRTLVRQELRENQVRTTFKTHLRRLRGTGPMHSSGVFGSLGNVDQGVGVLGAHGGRRWEVPGRTHDTTTNRTHIPPGLSSPRRGRTDVWFQSTKMDISTKCTSMVSVFFTKEESKG